MKKIYLFTRRSLGVGGALLLAAGLFFFSKNQFSPKNTPVKMPAAELEGDPREQEAWQREMLADPATGQIPEGITFKERWFAREQAAQFAADRSGNDWTSRGPFNVGGRTRALVRDVTNENRLMAGGASGGVWLSEDGGQSWTRTTPPGAHPGCVAIAQDPRPGSTNIWYYLSGELIGTSARGGGSFYLGDGMFKSTDNGLTWAALAPTAGGSPQSFTDFWQSGWRLAVSPVNGYVYAAVYNVIFRSTNGGSSWTAVLGGNTAAYSYFTDLAMTSTGVLYATFSSEGTKKGLWRSPDGTTWTNITAPNWPTTYDRVAVGINPNNENDVYFLGDTPNAGFSSHYISSDNWSSFWKYTYVSGDGSGAGGTWTDLTQNLPNTGTEFDRFAHQNSYDLFVKIQPGTGNVFLGGTNLWRSTDGFTTANNTTKIGGYKIATTLPFFELYPNHHPDLHDCVFQPSNPNVMISASDGGLHKTDDCLAPFVNWNYLNNGYQTSQFYTLIMDKAAGAQRLIGGLQDNGNFYTNSTDPAQKWKQTVNGDGAYGAFPEGKNYVIESIQTGRLVKTTLAPDGTVTAFQRIDPIGRTQNDYPFINALALDPWNQSILYWPAGSQVYRQSNLDALPLLGEWDSISTGWTRLPDTLTAGDFTAIAVSKNAPAHRVYLGTSRNRIFKIENADTQFSKIDTLKSPLADASGTATQPYISCLAVDPEDANNVVVVFSNYNVYSIFQSFDGGLTWRKVAGTLEANTTGTNSASPSIRWVHIMAFPNGSRRYFAGTSVGLYSATELKLHAAGQPGTLWTPEGAAMIGAVPVFMIDSRPSDGTVIAATHGHGMWTSHFEPIVGSHEPDFQALVRVSPNPTSEVATFFMPQNSQAVRLRVFDFSGKILREMAGSGERLEVDLRDLPAGAFAYSLTGKGWTKAGKLVKN